MFLFINEYSVYLLLIAILILYEYNWRMDRSYKLYSEVISVTPVISSSIYLLSSLFTQGKRRRISTQVLKSDRCKCRYLKQSTRCSRVIMAPNPG